jgi:hypothetical protein
MSLTQAVSCVGEDGIIHCYHGTQAAHRTAKTAQNYGRYVQSSLNSWVPFAQQSQSLLLLPIGNGGPRSLQVLQCVEKKTIIYFSGGS